MDELEEEKNKKRKWIIVSVSLIIVLFFLVGISVYVIYNLKSEIGKLNSDYTSISSKYYSEKDRSNALQNELNNLNDKYNTLKSGYDVLQSKFNSLQSQYDNLRGQSSIIQSNYQNIESENKRITNLLNQYEKVPNGYYTTSSFRKHDNTFSELQKFLLNEFELPKGYVLNIFDCSESSAYLEWALDNAGFDADIVTGKTPWGGDGYHAWVIAHNTDMTAAVEATALTGGYLRKLSGRDGIVRGGDLGANNYYNGYDNSFKNIYLAVKGYGTTEQWNWWEGYWGFA